jgi:hypothetical protein
MARVGQPAREQRRLEQSPVVGAHHLRRRDRRQIGRSLMAALGAQRLAERKQHHQDGEQSGHHPQQQQRSLPSLTARFAQPPPLRCHQPACRAAPVTAQRGRQTNPRRHRKRSPTTGPGRAQHPVTGSSPRPPCVRARGRASTGRIGAPPPGATTSRASSTPPPRPFRTNWLADPSVLLLPQEHLCARPDRTHATRAVRPFRSQGAAPCAPLLCPVGTFGTAANRLA